MVKVEANGGHGFNGGIGGDGGKVHIVAGQIIEIEHLENVIIQNNINRINQDFELVLKQIEQSASLKPDEKMKSKEWLARLKAILVTAEPYARPFIADALKKLSTG